MADRFYPLGLPSAEDVWRTTYEVQNEMRAFERSAYPPGTAIHLPGAREHFGYSNPGPVASRLAQPHLTNREDIGNPQPRAHFAIPRLQVPDDVETFVKHDVPEMMRSYASPMAHMTMSPTSSRSTLSRTRSLPALGRKTLIPPKLSQFEPPITKLEDEHYSYFVPKGLQREGRNRVSTATLSKLKKDHKVSFPFTGEGTGFSAQNPACDWFPRGSYMTDMPTASREAFRKPSFYRMSQLTKASALDMGS